VIKAELHPRERILVSPGDADQEMQIVPKIPIIRQGTKSRPHGNRWEMRRLANAS
jgi:hypothetical protein